MSIGIFDYKELYTLYDSVLHEANFDYFRKLNRLNPNHINKLREINQEYHKDINNIKTLCDSDYLNIGFFGETNAGKSLIIEILRILYDEDKRKKAIQEYQIQHPDFCGIAPVDGKIIGNGRSDYTTNGEEFIININNDKVILRDIPGIEGAEKKYTECIKENLLKSHVIFYVYSDAKGPDRNTLEKIKSYIKDETKIYLIHNVIFNGQSNYVADNIQQLHRFKLRINKEVEHAKKTSHGTVHDLFKNIFPRQYEALTYIVGFPALSSIALNKEGNASTLVEDQTKKLRKKQLKLLKEAGNNIEVVRDLSNLKGFQQFMESITESANLYLINNLKIKLSAALKNCKNNTQLLVDDRNIYKDIIKAYEEKKVKINTLFEETITQIDESIKKAVRKVCTSFYEQVCILIELKDGSYDKSDLTHFVQENKDKIISTIIKDLEKAIPPIINNFEHKIKEFDEDFKRKFDFSQKYGGFNIKFEFEEIFKDSDAAKVLGSMLLAAITGFLTPLGWIGAAIGAVVSLAGSILNWFLTTDERISKAKNQSKKYFDEFYSKFVKFMHKSDSWLEFKQTFENARKERINIIDELIDLNNESIKFISDIDYLFDNKIKKVKEKYGCDKNF